MVTMARNTYRQITGLLAAVTLAAAGCGTATGEPGIFRSCR